MKPFMQLDVITDDKLSPTSKRTVINLPCDNLVNALFDLGLVTEVDGYMNLKVLVVKQSGFQGEILVGQRLNFGDLQVWNELATTYCHKKYDFKLEAYMKFTGMSANEFLSEEEEEVLDEIRLIPTSNQGELRKYLSELLSCLYQIDYRGNSNFINWDAVLNKIIERGYVMLYKEHYVCLEPDKIGCCFPLVTRLNKHIVDVLADRGVSEDFTLTLDDWKFSDLLKRLEAKEQLVPAFLDNEVRGCAFNTLARLVSAVGVKSRAEYYERIWVKPVKEA